MSKNKSFVTTQRTKSKRVTITRTVEVPQQKPGEDMFNYYVRLKKLGLKLPKRP
jgi:hypothetical protein